MIVTGVRAYERRPDLRANNHRLLEYVRERRRRARQLQQAGVQPGAVRAVSGEERHRSVTDENAPVEVLTPDHPVVQHAEPDRARDWAGWVQERGTYFLAERDSRYVDLIRMTDPFPLNPGPKTGALVEARYGKGRWIYIGLGLWRQLPGGHRRRVPAAGESA